MFTVWGRVSQSCYRAIDVFDVHTGDLCLGAQRVVCDVWQRALCGRGRRHDVHRVRGRHGQQQRGTIHVWHVRRWHVLVQRCHRMLVVWVGRHHQRGRIESVRPVRCRVGRSHCRSQFMQRV